MAAETDTTQTLPLMEAAEVERMTGYDVLDKNDKDIGNVSAIWTDASGRPAFIGVRTFWLVGKTHVVPGYRAEVNHAKKHIRVPYVNEDVKEAPTFGPDTDLNREDERRILIFYQAHGPALPEFEPEASAPAYTEERREVPVSTEPAAEPTSAPTETHAEEARIRLHEEELNVGKRRVEAGGIRLRKIIRTETVQRPVELKREEIQVEHVPAGESRLEEGEKVFEEGEDIYIPLFREEAVTEKTVRPTEEVRARKVERAEEQTVSGEVRKEEVKMENEPKR